MKNASVLGLLLILACTTAFAQTLSPGYGGSLPPASVPPPVQVGPAPAARTAGGVPPFNDPYGTGPAASRFGTSAGSPGTQGTYGTPAGVQSIQDPYGTQAAIGRFGTPANR